MHNIDRTQFEGETGYEISPEYAGEFAQEAEFGTGQEFGQELGQEYAPEYGQEYGQELNPEYAGEFGQEYGQELSPEYGEMGYEGELAGEGAWNETFEMEMAAELLEVQNEAELEQFLGRLFRRIGQGARRVFRSPVFRTLGRALRGVAKRVLPIAGRVAGTALGGPAGGMIGGSLGTMASGLFEMELEGLSQEDREFEIARRFVRLAGSAARHALQMPGAVPPGQAARGALIRAARRHAPGLLIRRGGCRRQSCSGMTAGAPMPPPAGTMPGPGAGIGFSGRSGRWIRRGRSIILIGA